MSFSSHKKSRVILFLCTLSFLLLFCGCSTPPDTNESSEYHSGTPTPEGTTVPAKTTSFDSLLNDFFREYAASDTLSLHYTIQAPEHFGLEKEKVTLGHFNQEALLDSMHTADIYLDRLHAIPKTSLNESDQFLYDLLDYALQNSVFPEQAVLCDSPLGPTTGLQTQLPILLAEYRFSSLEDVEDYFLLLEDLPRYFSELCAFEQARSAAGTGSCAEVLSRIILQCTSFVEDPEHNFLIESFSDRLTKLPSLTAAQTAELCIRNQKLIFTCVLPAYEQLIDTLKSLLDASVSAKGLSSFPEGRSYYEYLVRSNTGSDKSIDELEQMLLHAFTENTKTMLTLYQSPSLQEELKIYQKQGLSAKKSEASEKPDTNLLKDSVSADGLLEYSSVLEQLQQQLCTDFPAPAECSFRVETIHPSLEDFISPALYLVPPLDAYKENVIYINRAKCSVESIFSTLAHEGYPGHLYQNTYFAAASPHPVRMLLNFTGYDEGWGTYAELYSYHYADCSEELRKFLVSEQIAGLCLYSLSDIQIHYHGADFETVSSFLQGYGFSAETAEEIFYTQLAEPAIYLPYSVGYLEFCELRDYYRSLTGADASLLPFHTFLLETGPAPFSLLRERLIETFTEK